MKEYNRDTKKWEEVDKATTKGTLKKRDLCKGKRPHSFELALPQYIQVDHELSQIEILQYYMLEDEFITYAKQHNERQRALGIHSGLWRGANHKHLVCTVCGKQDYVQDMNKSQ